MSFPIDLLKQNTTLERLSGFDVVMHTTTKLTIAFCVFRDTQFTHIHENARAFFDSILLRLAHYHSMRMS